VVVRTLGKTEKIIFNTFIGLKNENDTSEFRSHNNSRSFEFVGADSVDSCEGCDRENYSSQV